jgi:hypothetical protein
MADPGTVVGDVWLQQRAWSRAADRAKSEVGRYRVTSLLLVVLASGLGAAAPVVAQASDTAGRVCGLVAGISLGLIPIVRHRLDRPTYERWSRARSISEALKAEVYTYLAGAGMYRGTAADLTLQTHAEEIAAKGDDLVTWIAESDLTRRPIPAVTDVATYVAVRVESQIHDYYLRRGRLMAHRARLVRRVQAMLAIAAVVLGVIASAGLTGVAPWIGVIGTVSGAVIAHSAAARYSFLELEYYRTAEQLNRIIKRYRRSPHTGSELDDWLVAECERVISFQNEAWMAELVTTPGHSPSEVTIPPPV